jgi:hypothetical protein
MIGTDRVLFGGVIFALARRRIAFGGLGWRFAFLALALGLTGDL